MPDPNPGTWSIVQNDSKVTATHSSVLPNGKVVYFHARYYPVITYVYDPVSNTMELRQIDAAFPGPKEPPAVFCCGHSFLSDGKLLVAGGERPRNVFGDWRGLKVTFIYDYTYNNGAGAWFPAGYPVRFDEMKEGRWYPTLITVNDGRVLATSGYSYDQTNYIPPKSEIYDTATGWSYIGENDPQADMQLPLYPGGHVIPFGPYTGEILFDLVTWGGEIIPPLARRFNIDGTGSPNPYWNTVGTQQFWMDHGNSVMAPILRGQQTARLLNIANNGNVKMLMVGDAGDSDWIDLAPMRLTRSHPVNAVVLPDGNIMVCGGHDVYIPELLDTFDPNPLNWRWSDLPPMTVMRHYHSSAVLLPDARVMVAGSRIGGATNEFEDDMRREIEIFSPGYLYEGYRPEITSAPDTINYGVPFSVEISTIIEPVIIDSFVLINLSSATHGIDMNQKYISLDFFQIGPGGSYSVTPPANNNIAVPGYYLLFALKDKSQSYSGKIRIPSIAKILRLVL